MLVRSLLMKSRNRLVRVCVFGWFVPKRERERESVHACVRRCVCAINAYVIVYIIFYNGRLCPDPACTLCVCVCVCARARARGRACVP